MRVIFVSNRLPIVLERQEGTWSTRPGSGGLVTALVPLLKRWGGVWIGWPGIADTDAQQLDGVFAEFQEREGYQVDPVPLSAEEYERFYQGFCNEIIWPLFHDLQSRCNFSPDYWTSYLAVKARFADIIQRHACDSDLIWIHDYHLPGLARDLRERGMRNRLAYFLHIPFPPPDLFCKLPWRREVLDGLLSHDVIGFQTPRDLENFSDCIRKLLPHVRRHEHRTRLELEHAGGSCTAGAFPIGLDFHEFASAAMAPAVEQRVAELRQNFPGQQVILGVDRLDYTKGIPERLKAFDLALQRYPELHRAVTFLQVVVPSRENVPEYQGLKAEIERLVAHVNGKYTQPGWVPIHHVFRSVNRQELMAYYRLADVALVTPLKDGMNLVCKEYCACQADGNGVLVLSEFAGAAEQLGRWAVLVNPYDQNSVAAAIRRSVLMSREQRRHLMKRLRTNIRRQNVYWWVRRFLRTCGVRLRHAAVAHVEPTADEAGEAAAV